MTKFRIISVVLIFLLAIASMFGCSANNTKKENKDNGVMSEVKVTAQKLINPRDAGPSESVEKVADASNEFAFNFSRVLAAERPDKNANFVVSPFSVWLPLAALVNATDDAFKPGLLKALAGAGVSPDDINKAASRMLFSLNKTDVEEYLGNDFHNPLKIANAIFVGNNVTLKKEFTQTFMDYYRGSAINVDFSSQDAVDAVNKWASDNTEGLITNLINEFDPETIATIANAIYYSDRWDWEFDKDETTEGIFKSPVGDNKAHFMLREGDAQEYYEDEKVQAMPLSFASQGGLCIILPKHDDANELFSALTNEYFNEIMNDSVEATGKLLLPRFRIDGGIVDLKTSLISMGVPLFDKNDAPLTGGLVEEDLYVWLESAIQKAMIEVNEEGTTAAAVTSLAIAGSAMPLPTAPFEMICDKPFIFVLYDHTYDGGNQILFTGIVNQIEELS